MDQNLPLTWKTSTRSHGPLSIEQTHMPSNDPTVIRTVIDQKERQIDKLRDEVERLRKILLERDTGIPTDPDTVLPKNQNR